MAVEQYTEHLTLKEMNVEVGKNSFGWVFPQGDIENFNKIKTLLQKAGGKPDVCDIDDFAKGGNGKSKPEFVITFDNDIKRIIVVECKKSVRNHQSENLNKPKNYSVDGVLYYAKFLKEDYDVIAIAISGTKKENIKVDTFYWFKGQETYVHKKNLTQIYEPLSYLDNINGGKISKSFSLQDIREVALTMHDTLREIKVSERHKPVFIAGILIALHDKEFCEEYNLSTTFDSVITKLKSAIKRVLKDAKIKDNKVENIISAFNIIENNEKLKSKTLGEKNSITWYIEELDNKIKPMMYYANSTLDALSVFYHEFVKYSGGDGSGLGIVLTPQHLTEFMCEIANISKNDKVVDICCGSGSFLVSAMAKMFKDASPTEKEKIKKDGLYGVELDPDLFVLAISNMIIRGDGKSNIYHGDSFRQDIVSDLKKENINKGLINPPYSQKDYSELDFVENMLNILSVGGIGVCVVPMSCAIGTKFKEVRERLFKHHTLKAVFSMPDDIFYPTGTNVCVMLWEAHKPHDSSENTFFGYYKNDGFIKAKKLGRIDKSNKWEEIKKEWIYLYKEKEIKNGLTAKKSVKWSDEWLCEAYMETDYTKLNQDDFENTIKNYVAYLVKSGD